METPGPLDRELAAWKKLFKIKTGIAWSDRVSRVEENRGEAGNFQYEPPVSFVHPILDTLEKACFDFLGFFFLFFLFILSRLTVLYFTLL